MSKCYGCDLMAPEDKPFTTQCPLCQAEGRVDEGFFCSQACFAKNWIRHRDEYHPSGVVRVGAKRQKEKKEKIAKKRNRDVEEGDAADAGGGKDQPAAAPRLRTVPLWPVLSFDSELALNKTLSPKFDPTKVKRAVISVPSAPEPTAEELIGAQYYSREVVEVALALVATAATNNSKEDDPIVVCGSLQGIGLASWMARCSGLKPIVIASSKPEDLKETPAELISRLKKNTCTKKNGSSEDEYVEKTVIFVYEGIFRSAEKLSQKENELNFKVDMSIDNSEQYLASKVEEKYPAISIQNWVSNRVVVTMPDVSSEPSSYQSMTTTCWMMVPEEALREKDLREDIGEATHSIVVGKGSNNDQFLQVMPPPAATEIPFVAASSTFTPAIDNLLLTLLLQTEYFKAGERFAQVCINTVTSAADTSAGNGPSRATSTVRNAVLMSLGAFNGDAAEFHHSAANLLRNLLIHVVDKVKKTEVKSTCATVARAVGRVLSLLPAVAAGEGGNAKNTALHANITALYDLLPKEAIDNLASCWGLKRVVGGLDTLTQQINTIKNTVEKVKHRISPKQQLGSSKGGGGEYNVNYAVAFLMIVRAESMGSNLTVDEVSKKTCWETSSMLRRDFGPLKQFLADCDLLRLKTDAANKGPLAALSNKKGPGAAKKETQFKPEDYSDFVRPKEMKLGATRKSTQTTMAGRLPMVDLPLVGKGKKHKESLQQMARDEILSAMPVQPVPMYFGDVGQLIGKWDPFNARYEGVLPPSLSQFFELFPNDFAIVNNIVTRKEASKASQSVKVHYTDKERYGTYAKDSDDEDDARAEKRRLQKMLTGHDLSKISDEAKKRALSSRKARRQLKKKLTNKKRFDKNKKTFDPASMVPGYKKAPALKPSGRGKKANVRRWKRA